MMMLNEKAECYLKKFDLALRVKYPSNATIRNYYSCVKRFLRFAQSKDMPIDELIKQYLVWGIKSKEAKTINLHRSAVVCFFDLVIGQKIKVSDVPRRKESKKLPKIISPETICTAIRKTINLKHRIILMLFFDCGIRLCEMAYLKRKNILNEYHKLYLQHTKGNKERYIPISETVRGLLYEYIDGMNPDEYVFGGVCKRTIGKVVKSAFGRIGVIASPHMLRHSFATCQVMSGENVFKVQNWMGHGSIKPMMTYVHLSESVLSEKKDLLKENYRNF